MLPHLVLVVGRHGEQDEAAEGVDEQAGANEGGAGVGRVVTEVGGEGEGGHGHVDHPHLGEEPGLDVTKGMSVHVGEHGGPGHEADPALGAQHHAHGGQVDCCGRVRLEVGNQGRGRPRSSASHARVGKVGLTSQPVHRSLTSLYDHPLKHWVGVLCKFMR